MFDLIAILVLSEYLWQLLVLAGFYNSSVCYKKGQGTLLVDVFCQFSFVKKIMGRSLRALKEE